MPRQTEPNANNALGSLLQEMLPGRQVWSENTQAITGHAGLRPDIIVTAPGRSPVVDRGRVHALGIVAVMIGRLIAS